MTTVSLQSTTDSPELIQAALGVKEEVKDKSAPVDNSTEQKYPSDSETEETEEREASEESDGDEPKDLELDKPNKKGGFKRRIDKLSAAKAEAQREAEYWKSLALKGAVEKPIESKPVESKVVEGKPDPESFETHQEYIEAITDWKIETREKAAKEQAKKAETQAKYEARLKSHSERVADFAEKTDDFEEVVNAVDDVPAPNHLIDLILESENSPELMYEIAKNKDEYKRICEMSAIAAAREIGKIESKLASKYSEEKKPEQKKLTSAQKPLEPVGKSSKGSVTKSPEDMTFEEFKRWRSKN
jgi:hypothetical protein